MEGNGVYDEEERSEWKINEPMMRKRSGRKRSP